MKLFYLLNSYRAVVTNANSGYDALKRSNELCLESYDMDAETDHDIVVTMSRKNFMYFPQRELDQLNDQITDTMIDHVRFIRASKIDKILASELKTDPHDNGPNGDVYGYHFAGYDGVSRKCKINGINFYFFVD
jgi:hypothetical protein